jgi:hypothetical protein
MKAIFASDKLHERLLYGEYEWAVPLWQVLVANTRKFCRFMCIFNGRLVEPIHASVFNVSEYFRG